MSAGHAGSDSDDADDNAERAAARADLKKLARGWKPPKAKRRSSDSDDDEAAIDLALTMPGMVVSVGGIALCFASMIGTILVWIRIVDTINVLTVLSMFATAGAVCVGSIYVLLRLLPKLLATRQRRWLAALPFPFDRDAYLHALAADRQFTGRVRLIISPAVELDDETRAMLAHAASRACRRTTAKWAGDDLIVTSRELATSQSGGRGPGTMYNSNALHRWFRKAARRFLVPTAKAYALRRVVIDLE